MATPSHKLPEDLHPLPAPETPPPSGRRLTLTNAKGRTESDPSDDRIKALLASGEPFWLDLHEPNPGDVNHLAGLFGFHPLAIEDAEAFGQRPKADNYDDHTFLVVYGTSLSNGLAEVHCFISDTYLLSIHRDDCAAFPALQHRIAARGGFEVPGMLLYWVVGALTDSFFTLLEGVDERLDRIQDEIIVDPQPHHLHDTFAMKQQLVALRRVAAPQRDLLAQVASGNPTLPGVDEPTRVYLRDVYDHLIRLSDMIDTHRDLLAGVAEMYLAMVADRRDQVMKQLTLIATIFMPITFLTGYFGQNFGFMVDHIGSWGALAAGTGLMVLTMIAALALFWLRGWIGPSPRQGRRSR